MSGRAGHDRGGRDRPGRALCGLGAVGLASVAAALAPPKRPVPLVGLAFLPSLVLAETAPQSLVAHTAGVGAFVAAGAARSRAGRVGVAMASASAVGLVVLARRHRGTAEVMEAALADALGPGYRDAIDPALRAGLDGPERGADRALGLPLRPGTVERVDDVVYAERGDRRLTVDIYRRAGGTGGGGRPVLVQVHGGGWVVGHKRQQALPLMHRLARHGWVVVSVQYRLSPRATWPDHLDDVRDALAWVQASIEEHGGDPARVVVTGGSAGGHLCALAALTAPAGTVRGAVPFYGVYDWTDSAGAWPGPTFGRFLERVVVKQRRSEAPEVFERASPLAAVHPSAPPFLVIGARSDSLVPQAEGRRFVERLRAVSTRPVAFAELPHAQHAFDALPSARTAAVIAAVERFAAWAVS